MNVVRISLLCTIAMSASLAHVSTRSPKFFGDYDVDNIDFKEESTKLRSASSQLKRIELASKLILLGKLLLKQSRDESFAMRRNQAPKRIEKEESVLEKLLRDQRQVDRENSRDKAAILRNFENRFSQDDATLSRRAVGRCRCRPFMQCDRDNCNNNQG